MGSAGNATLRGTSPLETETWIPAFAESTPRIGLTYLGGNDEQGTIKRPRSGRPGSVMYFRSAAG